jgi:hypothetical protein
MSCSVGCALFCSNHFCNYAEIINDAKGWPSFGQQGKESNECLHENAVSAWRGLLEEVECFLFEAARRTGAPLGAAVAQNGPMRRRIGAAVAQNGRSA